MGQTELPKAQPRMSTAPVLNLRRASSVTAPLKSEKRSKKPPAGRSRFTFRRSGILVGIAALGTLALAALTITFDASTEDTREIEPILFNASPETLLAPGLIESETGQRNLSFEIPGILKYVRVQEGQKVRAGELIAELENADAAARVQSAQADLSAVEAQFKIEVETWAAEIEKAAFEVDRLKAELALLKAGSRKEEIAKAKAERKVADSESIRAYQDAERFSDPIALKSGAWSEMEVSRVKCNAEAAKGRLEMAIANQEMLENGFRTEEKDRAAALLSSAETELKQLLSTQTFKSTASQSKINQARAKLSIANADYAKTRLFAPINGVVVWKFLHTGEAVDPMRPIPVATVADTTRLRVRAEVDEADYLKIKKGQPVQVTADAFGERTFVGKVLYVSESAGQKRFSTGEAKERMDVRIVETIIALEESHPFKLGLRVKVRFDAGSLPVPARN